jgi:hypothetical protein
LNRPIRVLATSRPDAHGTGQIASSTEKVKTGLSRITVALDLRLIVLSLAMKSISTSAVQGDLIDTLHDKALGYSTVTEWLRQTRLALFSERGHRLAEDPQFSETGHGILPPFPVQRCASVRNIARLTGRPASTVQVCLAD